MAKKITEHDALKEIDLLLETLSYEERQRVMEYNISKHKILLSSAAPAGVIPPVLNSRERDQLKSDPKAFIASKKPQGFYEQIACLGYFLEKVQGLESFNTKDITTANTAARAT